MYCYFLLPEIVTFVCCLQPSNYVLSLKYFSIFITILCYCFPASGQSSHTHISAEALHHIYQEQVIPFVVQSQVDLAVLQQRLKQIPASDRPALLSIYLEMATKYNYISQSDSALHYINLAEQYASIKDHPNAAFWNICHQKASLYYRLGFYKEGLNYTYSVLNQLKTIKEVNKENELGKARLLSNISTFFSGARQYDVALAYLRKMDDIIYRYNDTGLIVVQSLLEGILNSEQDKGQLSDAVVFFKKARDLSLKKELYDQAFRSCINIAVSYYKLDSLNLALKYLDEAFSLPGIRYPYPVLAAYSTLGEVYFKLGRYEPAIDYLSMAMKGARQFNLKEIELYTHDFLYRIYKQQKDTHKALEHLEEFQALKSLLEGKEVQREISELEFRYQAAEKDKEIISANLALERQHSRFRDYAIMGIIALVILLGLLALLRFRNIKQSNKIQVLQKEQQISILKAVIQGEEQERKRIAGELHDGIGAMVAAIKMDVERIQKQESVVTGLKEVKNSLEHTSREIREVAHNLVPDTITKSTLQEALFSYCNKLSMTHDLDIEVQVDDTIPELKDSAKLTIYRIFQELIQNVLKHAQASKTYIQLRQHKEHLRITVEDNGIGFLPDQVAYGLGMNNIHLRVASLNGTIEVDSSPGMGSTFFISFRLNELCS